MYKRQLAYAMNSLKPSGHSERDHLVISAGGSSQSFIVPPGSSFGDIAVNLFFMAMQTGRVVIRFLASIKRTLVRIIPGASGG